VPEKRRYRNVGIWPIWLAAQIPKDGSAQRSTYVIALPIPKQIVFVGPVGFEFL
jgi:hypothetical protein